MSLNDCPICGDFWADHSAEESERCRQAAREVAIARASKPPEPGEPWTWSRAFAIAWRCVMWVALGTLIVVLVLGWPR